MVAVTRCRDYWKLKANGCAHEIIKPPCEGDNTVLSYCSLNATGMLLMLIGKRGGATLMVVLKLSAFVHLM